MSKSGPLQHGLTYHIYNRGNNRENIFIEERNYRYFLQLYAKYVLPVADTYAYCLLRNHFHFLVRIKTESELTGFENLSVLDLSKRPSQYFSNLFNAYARAFNKAYNRTGALFQRPFGRIQVTSNTHLRHLVSYIHQNPQKHNFVDDLRDWPYSSYHALISSEPTQLRRDDVWKWFGGRERLAHDCQRSASKEISVLEPADID